MPEKIRASEYPGIPKHPEIRRLIRAYERSLDEILDRTASFFQPLVTINSRLRLVMENASLFTELAPLQANRMWHVLALKMFAENGVHGFTCYCPTHIPECDVCERIDCHTFNVQDVLHRINEALAKGKIVPKPPFPSYLKDLDNIPPDERKRNLLRGGWYLPPFCNKCRCQILPSVLE